MVVDVALQLGELRVEPDDVTFNVGQNGDLAAGVMCFQAVGFGVDACLSGLAGVWPWHAIADKPDAGESTHWDA